MAAQRYSTPERVMSEFDEMIKSCELRAHCKRSFLRTGTLRNWLYARVEHLLEAAYHQREKPALPIKPEHVRHGQDSLFVFSILLELRQGDQTHFFHDVGLLDRLPIDLHTLESRLKDSDMLVTNVGALAADFDKLQWRYCPTKFRLGHSKIYLASEIVPIMRKEPINTKGGTAKVWQIEVLEDFVGKNLQSVVTGSKFAGDRDKLGSRYNFALKVFEEGHKAEYDNEIDAFRTLEGQDGMITYLGAYKQKDPLSKKTTYNILLEFGELDLDEYFFERSPPILTAEVQHFWKDLFKVAEAMKNIHTFVRPRGEVKTEYYGWHADIKPDNILLVRGEFKLADPGFAKFEKSEAFKKLGNREHTTMIHGGTKTYGAPECHPGRRKHVPVPRSIDIWSLGCVLSVAATWVVLGSQGILQFTEVREIAVHNIPDQKKGIGGDYFHDGTNVLPEVLQWHKYLRTTCRKSDSLTSQVLDLVDRKMLRGVAEERLTAAELCTELDRILKEGSSSEGFELPESLRDALIHMDDKAPAQPSRSKANGPGPALKSHSLLEVEPQDRKDRKEMKSQRYAETPRLKTTNRSEVLKPTSGSLRVSRKVADQTGMAEGEKIPPVPTPLPSTRSAKDQSFTPSIPPASARRHQPQHSLNSPPDPFLTKMSTSSIVLTPSQSDRDVQNVWQARLDIERRNPKNPFRSTGKDSRLSKYFGNRDIHFLIDNAGTMADFWDEAIYLLETLVMKAKGQDENGMDLSFTNSPTVSLQNSSKESKFREKMEIPEVRPSVGSTAHTDIRTALGIILNDYLDYVKDFLQERSGGNKKKKKKKETLRDLTIIIFTDGKWEGIGDKEEVLNTIVRFAKALELVQGEGFKMRQVSFEFVQFGFDADATYLLQRLDDELPSRGVADIVDTEPARGDVNKMLLGSFVEEYDEKKGDELILFASTPTKRASYFENGNQPRSSTYYTMVDQALSSSPPAMDSPPSQEFLGTAMFHRGPQVDSPAPELVVHQPGDDIRHPHR